MSNFPQRFPTLYECKIGQGQQGNCFKWALERVLSKIVLTMAYPGAMFNDITLHFPNRDWVNNPITDDMLKNNRMTQTQMDDIRRRIGLAQFFGDWIALYCGSEGDITEAYKVLDGNESTRVTDADVFTDDSMCDMTRPQSFANTPEVLMYNFSRIVNFILSDMDNIDKHINLLLDMKYPICLGIRDPTNDEVGDASNKFQQRYSGSKKQGYENYADYVKQVFEEFFNVLRNQGAFLDLKTVTLHRKPYVIYKGEQQLLVPQIDISLGNVSEDYNTPTNNYFGDIMEQLDNGLYAELSVYMPKQNADKYFQGLQTLTEDVARQKMLHTTMTLRSGNIGEKNTVNSLANKLPESTENISGHSMALKGIRVERPTGKDLSGNPKKPQIYITFINSWDNQTYVEYPANIFFRTDVHALLIIGSDPGHIRDLNVEVIQHKYMEISLYVPSCVPKYMLNMVASGDDSFRRVEGAPEYRVKLVNNQQTWLNTSDISPNQSPQKTCKRPVQSPNTPLSPIKIAWDDFDSMSPMEECTPEKCKDLPWFAEDKKRERDTEQVFKNKFMKVGDDYGSDTEVDSESEEYSGGAKNKTNKGRAKRVTRKLKKNRATCRLKKCRILKRHTHKKRNNKNPNHKKKQNKQTRQTKRK